MDHFRTGFFLTVLLISFFVSSCKNSIRSEKEYYEWLNKEDNGLVKVKKANGLKLTLKYLPNEYIVWKEYKDQKVSSEEKDSLLKLNNNSISFLLSISPDEETGHTGDVMYKDVANLREYKEKAYDMNFGMADYFVLHAGELSLQPVLVNLENTYSLTDSRNIYLVFTNDKQLDSEDTFDVVFKDEVFNTGINHFVFDKKDFLNVPEINFWKL